MAPQLDEGQKEFVQGLLDLADFLETHPDVIPCLGVDLYPGVDDAAEFVAKARYIGGKLEKETFGGYYSLLRRFGPHKIHLAVPRGEVCERVQIGTETREVPDPSASKVTVTEPVYEWKCPPSVLALANQAEVDDAIHTLTDALEERREGFVGQGAVDAAVAGALA